MAFDGVTISNIVKELNDFCLNGRIYKIAQPENCELLLTIRGTNGQKRILMSADASLPLIYFTENNKPSPMTAPGFCMLLRKHLQNGRIVSVSQPGLERIVRFEIEHLNEMGDLCKKNLIIELMGKHSNIIFCDENDCIIDSIKHVSGLVSSVREVLPGKQYFIPNTLDKKELPETNQAVFDAALSGKGQAVYKAIYTSFTGISPILSQELCYLSGIDSDLPYASLSEQQKNNLWENASSLIDRIKTGNYKPCIAYKVQKENERILSSAPIEYASIPLTIYGGENFSLQSFESISELLEHYYAEKNTITHIRQRSGDLRRIVQNALERNIKKYDLQMKQMQDTEKRDTYRVYGELINTYGYQVTPGSKSFEALNYYTNEMITIPLDPDYSTSENAKRYFEKYNKLKRTYEALTQLTQEVKAEIDHLESISTSLDMALLPEDLIQIKEELSESGYIHKHSSKKKEKITSKPFHYISSDGYHIYVGKNNYQNDELTFKFATGNDWWFHAKGMPGSHVVVKGDGTDELPDRCFEEAARLAAYYSKGRDQEKVEIDYIQKKHVKKPAGSKPGFVVYYTNYSMMIDTDISSLQQITN